VKVFFSSSSSSSSSFSSSPDSSKDEREKENENLARHEEEREEEEEEETNSDEAARRALRAKIGQLQERVKALRTTTTTTTPVTTSRDEKENDAVAGEATAAIERSGGPVATRTSGGGDARREGGGKGASGDEDESDSSSSSSSSSFSLEDILRASVSTLEDIFSGASSSSWDEEDDKNADNEEEREKTTLTVGIEKGAETVDMDGGREKRRTGGSNSNSYSDGIESNTKNKDNDDKNNRWEWQRQFDNPYQFMGRFKKAQADKGKEESLTIADAAESTSPPISPLMLAPSTTTTKEEDKDSTNAGANWIPDASAFLSRLPLPPLVGSLFSGSSSSSDTSATTAAAGDLNTATETSEEQSTENDERIIDERLRDANVNAVAVAINALQNLTAAIQEIDLQIDRESPPRTPRSPSKSSLPPDETRSRTSVTTKNDGGFSANENQIEEDAFNDLKEALSEAIKNADKAKAKLEDVELAANDVLQVRERIEKYRRSAVYKKNVSLTSSENGKRGLSESQPENIHALRQALEAAQVKLKEASASSRKQTVVVARQVLVLRELFEPGAQRSVEKSGNDTDIDHQREEREGLEETKRIDEGLYGKINSARRVAEDAIVATNITETLAKLTSWPGAKLSQIVTRQLEEMAAIDEDAEDFVEATTASTGETDGSGNLDSILQPALRNMVSSSLYRASEEDTKNARIACSLSSWIYNFPDQTTKDGLTRNGLTMIWNSHEHEEALSEDEINGNDGRRKQHQRQQPVDLKTSSVESTTLANAGTDAVYSEMNNAILLENLKKERHNREESIRLASAAADQAIKALASVKRMRELKPDDPNAAEAAKKATELANLVSQELTRVSEAQKTLKKERRALLRESEKISALKKQRAKLSASSENGVQKKKKNGNNKDAGENTVMPVNYCVCEDKENATLWIVIEGSTNFASWQTNLTWTPTAFEDKEIRVHQGAYACAKRMYDRVEKLCKDHLKTFGSKKARIKLTGHSIGGSLAYLLGLMLILRNGVPRYALDDIWTFGSPYVFDRGAEDLMQRIGLQRDFIKGVIMGKDIVPRSFSCYYPPWTRSILSSAPAPFKCVNMPTLLNEEMMYAPLGEMYLLQPVHGSAHPLLPEGPGFYKLQGEGMYDIIAAKARESSSISTIGLDASFDEESHWLDVQKDEHKLDFYADEASALALDENEGYGTQTKGSATNPIATTKEKTLSQNLNKIACLTQADAALTASLIISQIDRELLTKAKEGVGGDLSVMMREQTRDAAQRVILNTPHPLTVLSDPRSYGSQGSISRHHNPYSYQKALSRAAKALEGEGNKEDS
jgi:hypothetical protein